MKNFEEVKKAAIQLGYAMASRDALKESVNIGGERGFGADIIVKHLETKLKELMDEHSNPEEKTESTVKQ